MTSVMLFDISKFTPIQRRLVEVLSDGCIHSKRELLEKCLEDDLASLNAVTVNICYLRKKLPAGVLVLYVKGRSYKMGYQMVRHINSSNA